MVGKANRNRARARVKHECLSLFTEGSVSYVVAQLSQQVQQRIEGVLDVRFTNVEGALELCRPLSLSERGDFMSRFKRALQYSEMNENVFCPPEECFYGSQP